MQKTKLPSLITLLILTLITVLMWVGFGIYRAFTTTPAPSVPKEISEPLNPTLDKSILDKIEGALYFGPSQIPGLSVATSSPNPTPQTPTTPIPSPSASASATPIGTPTATPTP